MNMKKILLADASAAQLRHFAEVTLGLEVSPSHNSPTLIAKIGQARPDIIEIEVEDVPEPINTATIQNVARPADVEKDVLTTHSSDDPKVTILIPSTPGKGGDRDVQICHNGDVFLVKRDVEAEVPYRILVALRSAREQEINQTVATPGMPAQIVVREVFAYGFQVIEGPSKAEIAEWEKRMSGIVLGGAVAATPTFVQVA